ncbi:hypothetical protein [Cellulosimicrobium sp. SH8]|uniref:hypothetical protein n=1 Tax=Cellulosimicrobium sp. SH8 TaxID=2952936 RepID=UPI0021F283CB|nr:hypothetical protein [Cellulosimicrobium sp. SH8]
MNASRRTRPRQPRRQPPRDPPLRWWSGLLLAAVPLGIGALLLRASWDDLSEGEELVPALLVLAFLLAFTVGAVSLTVPRRIGNRVYAVAKVLVTGTVTLFFGWVVIGGLLAPELVATGSGSGRAPSTPLGARITAVIAVLAFGSVAVQALVDRRRRRRRSQGGGGRAPLGSGRFSRSRRR